MIDRTKIPGDGWRKRWREKIKNLNEWDKEKKNRKTEETNTVKYVCWIEWKHRRKNDENSNNRISDWIIKWKKKRKKNGKESNITPQSLLSRRRRASVLIIINTVTVSCYTHIGEIKIKSRSSNMDGFIRWLSCEFHRTRLINSHILFSFPLFPFRRHEVRARTDKRTNETRGRATLYRLKFAIRSMQFRSSWNYIFT